MKYKNRRLLTLVIGLSIIASCSKEDDTDEPKPKPTPVDCFEQRVYTQQLPNMDFEEWGSPDSAKGKYMEPCGGVWTSFNAFGSDFGITNSEQTADAQNGSYALRLTTRSFIGPIVAPGVFFTGKILKYELDINDVLNNAEIGVPFVEKPISFKGYHKYVSKSGDSAYVAVMLTRWDSGLNQKDTVGFGEFTILNSVTSYTEFNINIDYSYAAGVEVPDSLVIFCTSSKDYQDLQGAVGSQLQIDNCSFIY